MSCERCGQNHVRPRQVAYVRLSFKIMELILRGQIRNIAWSDAPLDLEIVGVRIPRDAVGVVDLYVRSEEFEEVAEGKAPPEVTFHYGSVPRDSGPVAQAL